MSRVRVLTVLLIALLAGGGLAFGTYSYLQNVPVKTVTQPTRKVVIANNNLALGHQLRREDLTAIEWPKDSVPEGSFEDPASLVDRGVIVPLVRHEVVLPAKLASKESGAGLPPIIPTGKRAVSVRVNEVIGVAGYVLPGTRVDVVATANPSTRSEDVTSKVVLSNVEVLTAGTRLEQDSPDGKPMQVSVVTLLVNPEDSEKLTLASTEGKIQLALRNPLDTSSPPTPGIKPGVLLGLNVPRNTVVRKTMPNGVTVPTAILPPPTVEIIRGDKRVQVVVDRS